MYTRRFFALTVILLGAALPLPAQEVKYDKTKVDALGDPLPEGALARLGTGRLRSDTSFNALAFTPDGKYLVSGNYSAKLQYWEVATGKRVKEITTSTTSIYGIQFSKDGKIMAVAAGDGSVRILDGSTGAEKKSLVDPLRRYGNVAFTLSPDGKTVVTANRYTGKEIIIWDAEKGTQRKKISNLASYYPGPVVFLPDSSKFITLWTDNKLHLVDAKDGTSVRNLESATSVSTGMTYTTRIQSVALSSDGKKIVFRPYSDQYFHVVDVTTGKETKKFQRVIPGSTYNYGTSTSMTLTPNDRFLIDAGSDASVRVWGLASGKMLRDLVSPSGGVYNLAVSKDGKKVAHTSNNCIILWDITEAKQLHGGSGHQTYVNRVAYSPDGKYLASTGSYSMRVWEAKTGKEVRMTKPYSLYSMQQMRFSKDGKTIKYIASDRALYSWKYESDQTPLKLTNPKTTVYYSMWSVSPDGKRMAAINSSDRKLRIVDLLGDKTDKDLGVVGTSYWSTALVFSPDSKTLLSSSSSDRVVVVYNAETGVEIRRILPIATTTTSYTTPVLSYANCGRTFLRSDTELQILEAQTGSERVRLPREINAPSVVAWSNDGRLVARSDYSGVVIVYDVISGKELIRRFGGQGTVYSLAFSPDGRQLSSGGSNTTILVWDVPTPDKIRRVTGLNDEKAWRDLASSEASTAWQAIIHLAASPTTSVKLIKEKMKPRPPVDTTRIGKLIEALDDDDYKVREKASSDLAEIGSPAETALKATLKEPPSLEVKKRVTKLLQNLRRDGIAPERLRDIRVVEALELMKHKDATELLQAMAKQKLEPRLLDAVNASLKRLAPAS